MNSTIRFKSALALFAIVATTFAGLKDAAGELIFEDDLSSGRAQASHEDQTLSGDAQSADENVSGDSVDAGVVSREKEKRQVSRSEALRRHRLRAELKNEDKLTEKLEELRLKDEMKRMDALFKKEEGEEKSVKLAEVQEQKINAAAAAPIAAQQNVVVAEASKVEEEDEFTKSRVSVAPRAGLISILNSGFDLSAKYAAGVMVAVDVSDHFAIDSSYTYGKYNITAGNAFSYGSYGYTMQTLGMSQHLFDLGARFNILGKSRVRPFIGAGFGYFRSTINLDEMTQNFIRMYNPTLANDYVVSGMTGHLKAGVEYRITKLIGLVGAFQYYQVLTSTQSNPISSAAFVSPNGTNASYYGASTMGVGSAADSRFQASRNVAHKNFFSLMAGVSFSF